MRFRFFAAVLLVSGLIFGVTNSGISEEQTTPASVSGADALPNAKPGECYAKVLLPAQYKDETETVIKREAYEKIEIIPAKYEVVQEKIMVKQGSENITPVDPAFKAFEGRVEVQPARTLWRTGKSSKSGQADSTLIAGAHAMGLPASAKEGECYAEYHQPAQYKTETEDVVIREAYEGVEIIPAQYELVDEQVVVKEASFKLEEIPPVYETVTEKVLEAAAYTTWKSGRGPVERIDNTTGDIMCLVEVPAKYKTVEKKVLKSPATTRKVEIPAEVKVQKVRKLVSPAQIKKTEIPAEKKTFTKKLLISEAKTVWQPEGQSGPGKLTGRTLCLHKIPARYETVTKQLLKAPATTKKVEIPAEFKSQQVRRLVSPAQVKRIQVPPEVETFNRRVKVADASLEWRPILCQTNMSKDLNTQIQTALLGRGFNPGEIDGVIGRQTMIAVSEFQQKEGLPRGGLTLRTLGALGVNPAKELPASNVRTKLQ